MSGKLFAERDKLPGGRGWLEGNPLMEMEQYPEGYSPEGFSNIPGHFMLLCSAPKLQRLKRALAYLKSKTKTLCQSVLKGNLMSE